MKQTIDHKKEEHEKDKPQIKCETCGVTFKYIWTYNKHALRSAIFRNFICF